MMHSGLILFNFVKEVKILLALFPLSFYHFSKTLRDLDTRLLSRFKLNVKQLLLVINIRLTFSLYAICNLC